MLIPHAYRTYTAGLAQVKVTGTTVKEAFEDLVRQHPGLRSHVMNPRGDIRPFVNLFLNGENVRQLEGVNTPLHPGDELRIVPSIAGG